ncbi:MAG: DinB family protein [Thermomicrobiales bacterium]
MSERSAKLADHLDAAFADTIAFAESVPDDQWTAFVGPEQCTIAALASHIEGSTQGVIDVLVKPIAEQREIPAVNPGMIDAMNAKNAEENAERPKAETLDALRQRSQSIGAYLRGMSDEELDRTAVLFFSPDPVSAEAVIHSALINHVQEHLASMKQAVA